MLNWVSFWRQLGGNFHTPGNPAVARCYINIKRADLHGNKYFKGCGKTFHVKYLYYMTRHTVFKYTAVRRIYCTFSVLNCLQLE